MILIKTNKEGATIELSKNDNYKKIVDFMDFLTEENENIGIFLINKEVAKNLTRTYEFATIKGGWECVFILAHGYIGKII